MKWRYLALLLLLLFVAKQAFAEVTFDRDTKSMVISGPTDMNQVVKASNILREEEVDRVYMWGPGGFFEIALDLGNRLKKEDVVVIVPEGKTCISACAFIALGGSRIEVDGAILFHRPFAPYVPTVENIESIVAYGGAAYIKMARYVEDMGYGRKFTDYIVSYTTPCKFMRWSDKILDGPKMGTWSTDDRCNNSFGFVR